MSGGSFDYLYRKMEDGDAQAFLSAMETSDYDPLGERGLLHYLDRALERLRRGEPVAWNGNDYVPHPEPERAIAAVEKMRARFVAAREEALRLKGTLTALAPVAHLIEWWASGDTEADDLIEECMK